MQQMLVITKGMAMAW